MHIQVLSPQLTQLTWACAAGPTSATASIHAPTAGSGPAATTKAVREVGHELLPLPLHLLFVWVQKPGTWGTSPSAQNVAAHLAPRPGTLSCLTQRGICSCRDNLKCPRDPTEPDFPLGSSQLLHILSSSMGSNSHTCHKAETIPFPFNHPNLYQLEPRERGRQVPPCLGHRQKLPAQSVRLRDSDPEIMSPTSA